MKAALTEDLIRSLSSPQSFQRGSDLYLDGAIFDTTRQGDILLGKCEGNMAPFYELRVELDEGGVRAALCSCPYDFGGLCKHLVALLLALLHSPEDFAERRPVKDLLKGMDRDSLVNLLADLAERDPGLYGALERAAAVEQARKAKGRPPREKRKTGVSEQVYRRQVKNILNSLSGYRMSEAYWMMGGMVGELRQVQDTALQFLDAGDAEGTLTILMTLLQETTDAYEQFDDSDGLLGDFLGDLGRSLAEAILSLDLSKQDRRALEKRLGPIVDELSDYGIDEIEIAMLALEQGWTTVEAEMAWEDNEGYFGDLTEIKLNVLDRQGRADEYLSLCQAAGQYRRYALKLLELERKDDAMQTAMSRLTDAEDALAVAQRLRELGYVQDSILLGERGLQLAGPKHNLGTWLGPLEEAQGRFEAALKAYRAAFLSLPSLRLYQTVERLSGPAWGELKRELILVLQGSAYRDVLADVYLLEGEWDAAVQLADTNRWDFRMLEKVAVAVLPHRPEWVIRVSLQQSDGLIAKTQSKYYAIAAEWLQRAKQAHGILGRQAEWERYLAALKAQYSRRPALQAELRKL